MNLFICISTNLDLDVENNLQKKKKKTNKQTNQMTNGWFERNLARLG
jgi:hypothetical protein